MFFELCCPQCNVREPTFRRYEVHLQGRTHQLAMRRVAVKQRSIIAMMRMSQRNAQNELEKSGEGITEHTVFCPLCKLNYKQERAVHQATAAHKNMKKLLMPSCKVCKKNFKSGMVYEHHLCSIDHLRVSLCAVCKNVWLCSLMFSKKVFISNLAVGCVYFLCVFWLIVTKIPDSLHCFP